MKKLTLFALVAALALATGLSSLAAAGQDGATASAKKVHKKGKRKGCRGKKKGQRHSKAHRSATASKGKKKGKGCKRGGKGASGLRVGTYEGQGGIGLNVTAGGKMAALIVNGTPGVCIPVPLEFPAEPATSTAKLFKAGGKKVSMFGGYGEVRWVIEVNPQLKYKLALDASFALPEQDPCNKPTAHLSGTLKKTS